MDMLDLSYQILTGGERKLLVAEDLIKNAQWLEEQGLVRCAQEECGMRVQLNLEGIDAWMMSALNKLAAKLEAYEPCVYGIALLKTKPELVVRNGDALFMIPAKCFLVQTSESPRTYGNNDIVVHFADIFCEKINLRQLVERIANNRDIAFALKWEKGALYLNEHVIVTARASMRKAIMQILIKHQKTNQEYISFEKIADNLQEQHEFLIDDIHSQIYRHIHVLQQRVQEKVPQCGAFIESRNNRCRLNPAILVMDKKNEQKK
jgi:Fe2+ or Zn2+ uptake regulation protein